MNQKFNKVAKRIFEHGLKSISGLESCESPFLDEEGFG